MYKIPDFPRSFLNTFIKFTLNNYDSRQNIKQCNSPLKADLNDVKLRSRISLTAASNTSVVAIKVKQSA